MSKEWSMRAKQPKNRLWSRSHDLQLHVLHAGPSGRYENSFYLFLSHRQMENKPERASYLCGNKICTERRYCRTKENKESNDLTSLFALIFNVAFVALHNRQVKC